MSRANEIRRVTALAGFSGAATTGAATSGATSSTQLLDNQRGAAARAASSTGQMSKSPEAADSVPVCLRFLGRAKEERRPTHADLDAAISLEEEEGAVTARCTRRPGVASGTTLSPRAGELASLTGESLSVSSGSPTSAQRAAAAGGAVGWVGVELGITRMLCTFADMSLLVQQATFLSVPDPNCSTAAPLSSASGSSLRREGDAIFFVSRAKEMRRVTATPPVSDVLRRIRFWPDQAPTLVGAAASEGDVPWPSGECSSPVLLEANGLAGKDVDVAACT